MEEEEKLTAEPSVEGTGDKGPVVNQEVESLKAELVESKRRLSESDQKVTRQAGELQSRQDYQTDIQALRGEIQLVAALAAEGRSPEEAEDLPPKEKGDMLQRFQAMQAQNEARRTGDTFRKRTEALGLSSKDKAYREIYRDVREGNFEFADASLRELEGAKVENVTPPPAENKDTEEERFTKRLDEEKRKWMEDSGQLESETGRPSAAHKDAMETVKRFSEGDSSVSMAAYEEAINKIS